jgi:hypothetical protein
LLIRPLVQRVRTESSFGHLEIRVTDPSVTGGWIGCPCKPSTA